MSSPVGSNHTAPQPAETQSGYLNDNARKPFQGSRTFTGPAEVRGSRGSCTYMPGPTGVHVEGLGSGNVDVPGGLVRAGALKPVASLGSGRHTHSQGFRV